MAKKENKKKKGFFGNLLDKLDKKIEKKSKVKTCKCCRK